jgi:hypothetical protein
VPPVEAPTASVAAEGFQASVQHAETCVQTETDTDAEQSAAEAGDDSDDLFVRPCSHLH